MCYEFEWYWEQRKAEEARKALKPVEEDRRAKEQKPKEPAPDKDAEPVPV